MSNISVPASACAAAAIPTPTLFGGEILAISANLIQNFTREVSDQLYYNNPSVSLKGIDYCNITVTYTHPGQGDTINVENWLPLNNWNGRFQAIGGGGFIAGRFSLTYTGMAGAMGQGYATSSSDAGLPLSAYTPDEWALISEGNVDMYNLQNLGSVSLNDQAIISKAVISNFYGQAPAYSYWSGCSQGGRQGMMLAQRYPEAYDGIAASAPAFNWGKFFTASSWAQIEMALSDTFPYGCELDAITSAALEACDPLDGVTDGLVSDPDTCTFDPFSVVGNVINCTQTGGSLAITEGAARIANLTYTGPRTTKGKFLWYGPDIPSRLTGATVATGTTSDVGYAMTTCTSNGTCTGVPIGLGEAWMEYWVMKNSSWSTSQIKNVDEYTSIFHAAQQFDSEIDSADPNLNDFFTLGGKMITYHGLADGIIPVKGTTDYYNKVLELEPAAQDFFRYFQVPGLEHCSGGSGGQPTATFQALVDWVENSIVPETLPINFTSSAGTAYNRILCPYPAKVTLKSGCADETSASCFECTD